MSPLNWGIGHAARLVPIAQQLHAQGAIVYICASGAALNLMRIECGFAHFIDDVPFEITYGKSKWTQIVRLLTQLPKMWIQVFREHELLKKIVQQYNLDLIISDNRYGFYHRQIPCIFITHQLQIQLPFGASLINFLNHCFIKKFTACWVPDWEEKEKSLAGKLSRKKGLKNVQYIGPLSRFRKKATKPGNEAPILYLLSGVEPQRSLFEELILKRIAQQPHKAILVRGTAMLQPDLHDTPNLKVYNLIDAIHVQALVEQCKFIVSRSGYSSIMDIIQWQKNAVLVPTPGQYEQEYLAAYLAGKKWFYTINQNDFLEFKEEECKPYQCPSQQIEHPDFSSLLAGIS